MKIIFGLLAVAMLCLSATAAHATTIRKWKSEIGANCTDIIEITSGNCVKWLTRDCDDSNPCGWLDHGWNCHLDGGSIQPSGGASIPATFDGNGNLVCTVEPGTGGVYSSGSSGGVCFAADHSSTLIISASIINNGLY